MTNPSSSAPASGACAAPGFGEEHEMLRAQLRRFVEKDVKPHADAWEADGKVPREVLRRMGELGFLGVRYPVEYGGSAMDTLASVVVAEELARSTFGGFAVTVLVHTEMASPHLFNAGNAQQLARWGADIVAGRKITAVAVTEPGAGSDVAGLATTARRDGHDYVLNGRKLFITNGVHADLYFVAARTGGPGSGNRGISMFAVEKGTPGFSVARELEKQGWLSSDTAELLFEDCRVPVENLLGDENRGFYAVMRNFQNERIVLSAQAMAEASVAIELALDWVRQRRAFGGVLWDKQTVRLGLAKLAAKVEAGRSLVHRAAVLDAQGVNAIKEVSMAKAYCGELVSEVMYLCQQFHGGMGYMRGTPIERMVRDARIHSIGGGATEVMLEEIAKRM